MGLDDETEVIPCQGNPPMGDICKYDFFVDLHHFKGILDLHKNPLLLVV